MSLYLQHKSNFYSHFMKLRYLQHTSDANNSNGGANQGAASNDLLNDAKTTGAAKKATGDTGKELPAQESKPPGTDNQQNLPAGDIGNTNGGAIDGGANQGAAKSGAGKPEPGDEDNDLSPNDQLKQQRDAEMDEFANKVGKTIATHLAGVISTNGATAGQPAAQPAKVESLPVDDHAANERKYGKGYITASRNGANTIFTATGWANLKPGKDGTKDGWKQIIEVPKEVQGLK